MGIPIRLQDLKRDDDVEPMSRVKEKKKSVPACNYVNHTAGPQVGDKVNCIHCNKPLPPSS